MQVRPGKLLIAANTSIFKNDRWRLFAIAWRIILCRRLAAIDI